MNLSYLYNYHNVAYDAAYGQVFKSGSCNNLRARFNTYTTYYIDRGKITEAYEFQGNLEDGCSIASFVESKLHHYLIGKGLQVYREGATEFFRTYSKSHIEPFIESLGIPYRKLTQDDIFQIELPEYNKTQIKTDTMPLHMPMPTQIKITLDNGYQPLAHQEKALDKFEDLITTHRIVKLIWACGLGKALFSVFAVKTRNFQTIAIGVPSKHLQHQMRLEILKVFPFSDNILFVGGDSVNDKYGLTETTNNISKIFMFLKNEHIHGPRFVIATYHSCYLLANMDSFIFDFKIGDEAHHLVCGDLSDKTSNSDKQLRRTFRMFHYIQSKYTLFMTATEKLIESNTGHEVFSMDDEKVFGKLVDTISVKWAIEHHKITDYMVVLLKNREDDIDLLLLKLRIQNANKDLFLSSYMALKSIEKYSDGQSGPLTHMLLYTNTTEDADLANKYIQQMVEYKNKRSIVSFNKSDLYAKSLHSNSEQKIILDKELDEFKRAKFGIVSCVYMFGEGFNLPELNGVCIASNMNSEIRIVQYLLRPNRLNSKTPDKIAYIVIPYLDTDEFASNNSVRYGRVRDTISQLRNIDEAVCQKMRLVEMKPREFPDSDSDADDEDYSSKSNINNMHLNMFESEEELAKIKLRLRYSKALNSTQTQEQNEYDYVRVLNRELKINCTQKYVEVKDTHPHYIDNPDIYFGDTWRGWFHFWGIDTDGFIQSKEEWIRFCREKKVTNVSEYLVLCGKYAQLPLNPELLYKGFTNIYNELDLEKRRR